MVVARTLSLLLVLNMVKSECTPEALSQFPGGWPTALDTGIYWYGANDQHEKATGYKSQFYDPLKPTIIFIHGWTGYNPWLEQCRRGTSVCTICPDGESLSKPWVEKGWNYGMLYWDQFSDEACLSDAELKIWMNPSNPQGLTWKSFDYTLHKVDQKHYDSSTKSLGHLCAQLVREALRTFTGSDLRLAGHSLGAQLAAHCGYILHNASPAYHAALPTRLVLLDPIFTGAFQHFGLGLRKVAGPLQPLLFHCLPLNGSRNYGDVATRSMLQAITSLWKHGVATEVYKGSTLSTKPMIIENPFKELETLGAYVVQNVDDYCKGKKTLECMHNSLVPLYMLRIADPQPVVFGGVFAGNCSMPGPACSDQQILAFIHRNNGMISQTGKRLVWHQIQGSNTLNTYDDSYTAVGEIVPTNAILPAVGAGVQRPTLKSTSSEEPRWYDWRHRKDTRTFLLVILCVVGCLCFCGGCSGILLLVFPLIFQIPPEVREVTCCESRISLDSRPLEPELTYSLQDTRLYPPE